MEICTFQKSWIQLCIIMCKCTRMVVRENVCLSSETAGVEAEASLVLQYQLPAGRKFMFREGRNTIQMLQSYISFKHICSGSSREKHNFTFTWDVGFWLMGFSWLWWCFVSRDFSSCRRLATCCRECTAVTGWNSPSNLIKVKQPDQMIFAKISFLLFFDLGKGSNDHSDFKPFLVFSSYLALAIGSV